MRTRTLLLLAVVFVLPANLVMAQTLSLADRVEMQQLYARYAHAMDASDAKLLATVYTPDAEFVVDGTKMSPFTLIKGPARPRPNVRHVSMNVTFDASAEGARGSAYLLLVNLQATPPAIIGGGIYEDVIVKTMDGWRFKSRMYYSEKGPAPAAAATK